MKLSHVECFSDLATSLVLSFIIMVTYQEEYFSPQTHRAQRYRFFLPIESPARDTLRDRPLMGKKNLNLR